MGLSGRKKTWDELCEEYKAALLAGDDSKVFEILKEKLEIAEAENDMMKKVVVNAEWLSLKQRLGMR